MKKLFTTLMLLAAITPVFADDFFEPEWSEFCPSRYANVNPDKRNLTVPSRYWASRRIMFEKRLAQCNALSSDKRGACYENLRWIENESTNGYNEQKRTMLLQNIMLNTIR